MGTFYEPQQHINEQEINNILSICEEFAYEGLTVENYKRQWSDDLKDFELKYFNEGYKNGLLKIRQNNLESDSEKKSL